MKKSKSLYYGHRFPAEVISCAVRWYFRFQLSLRDIEELLFERGVIVTYETIRCWCDKFGAGLARRVKAARRKPGSTGQSHEKLFTHNRLRMGVVNCCEDAFTLGFAKSREWTTNT